MFTGGEGDDPRILGIGVRGVWRLPAAPGAEPDWACGVKAPPVVALSTSGALALARELGERAHAVCLIDPGRPGQPVFEAEVHHRLIKGLAFSPDGTRILTASRDGRARVIDARTGEPLLDLPREGPIGRSVNRAIFDPDGRRIAVAASDDRLRVYEADGTLAVELSDGRSGGRTYQVHTTTVRDLAFTPDGRYLLVGDDEGQVVRWDLNEPGQAIVLGAHELGVERVVVSSGSGRRDPGPLALTASADRSARLWDLDTGKPLAVLSHDAVVNGAALGAGGQRIMTWSATDGSARLWSLEPVPRMSHPLRHQDHVVQVALARAPQVIDPEGDLLLLATGTYDGGVRVYGYRRNGAERSPELLQALDGHRKRIRRVAFSGDGRWLASASADGTARVWDVATRSGGCVLPASPAGEEVYRVLFSPDAALVLTASRDTDAPLRLWHRATCAESPPGDLAHIRTAVQGAAAGPRGRGGMLIAAGDDVGRVRVLARDAAGPPRLLCDLPLHEGPIPDVAVSRDGRWLASGGDDGRVAVVGIGETGCGEPVWLAGHTAGVNSVVFSAGGGRLITASDDATARVWDRDGRQLAVLDAHGDRIYRAELDGRGDFAVTASRDGSVRVWKVPPAVPEGEAVLYLVLAPQLGRAITAGSAPTAATWPAPTGTTPPSSGTCGPTTSRTRLPSRPSGARSAPASPSCGRHTASRRRTGWRSGAAKGRPGRAADRPETVPRFRPDGLRGGHSARGRRGEPAGFRSRAAPGRTTLAACRTFPPEGEIG